MLDFPVTKIITQTPVQTAFQHTNPKVTHKKQTSKMY